MRSIRLIVGSLAEAVLEGKAIRRGGAVDEDVEYDEEEGGSYEFDDDASDDELLGESTRAALQKLRNTPLDLDEDED
ncbi:MAG: hypothetical protein KC496_17145, partial [Anaerolineae bacterium]|nr:hypothetical protein [Anaerolineae bacterium]